MVAPLQIVFANVGDSHRVPILSAASSKASSLVTGISTNNNIDKTIEYVSIASVIRRCDNGSLSSSHPSPSFDRHSSALSGSSAQI